MIAESLDSRLKDRLVPFVVVADAVCLVGSNLLSRVSDPRDVDILVRWYGSASELPNSIRGPFESSKRIQFITEPAGPHSNYIPLYHFYFMPVGWAGNPTDSRGGQGVEDSVRRVFGSLTVHHRVVVVLQEALFYRLVGPSAIEIYCPKELPEIAPLLKLRKLLPDVTVTLITEWGEDFLPLGSLVAYPVQDPVLITVPETYFEPFKAQKRLQEHDPVSLDLISGNTRVDLGCGDSKPDGWIGLDLKEGPGVDIVWDAENPLPFKDDTVDAIRAHHFLEHISDQEHILREIHRVLKPGGLLIFEVPSTRGEGAFSHPDHKSYFNLYTWMFYTRDHLLEGRPKFEVVLLDEFSADNGRLWYVSGVLAKPLASEAVSEARNDSGVMLAVPIPPEVATKLLVPGGEPGDVLHITLFYFGDSKEWLESDVDDIGHLVSDHVSKMKPFQVHLDGTGTFQAEDDIPFYAAVSSDSLLSLRAELAAQLDSRGFSYSKDHDYHPHVTLAYLRPREAVPDVSVDYKFAVTELILTYMGSSRHIELGGAMQESYSRSKCMTCDSPPEVEIRWAEGMARAWFCEDHFQKFRQDNPGEVNVQCKVPHGVVGKQFGDYSEKSVSEAIHPFSKFTPQKPRVSRFTEHFSVDQLWTDWAKKRVSEGKSLVAEMKLNGFRTIAEKQGDRVRLSFEKTDVTSRLPKLVSILRSIPEDFILDGDIGILRDIHRLPRVALMTLMAEEPRLRRSDTVVFTVFDALYIREALSEKPFSERRKSLKDFFSRHGLSKYGNLDITDQQSFSTKSQLQIAYNKFGRGRGSEGLVVKVLEAPYDQGGTESISKLKNAVEIKATVLHVTTNKNGTYSFRSGVFPGRSRFQNITEFQERRYVDFGKSFNSSFKAEPGDIVTFSVEEIIVGTENGKPALQWLGARPLDIDRERKYPYFANQVVSLAERGNVLQEEVSESKPIIHIFYEGSAVSLGETQDK